jgi:hypothetical protein
MSKTKNPLTDLRKLTDVENRQLTDDEKEKLEKRIEFFSRDFLTNAVMDNQNKGFFLEQAIEFLIDDVADILNGESPTRINGVLEVGQNYWDTEFPIPAGYRMNALERWYYRHQIYNAQLRATDYAKERNEKAKTV